MKVKINIILFFLIQVSAYSQFGDKQIISSNAFLATTVYTADINGDGFIDVLSSSRGDDKIAWYANLDGHGTFGNEQIVGFLDQTTWAIAADLDNDGDQDIMATTGSIDNVVWYENLDGLGDFGPEQMINDNAISVNSAIAEDLDNDGDLDVISVADSVSGISWYENINGNFSNAILISNSVTGSRFISTGDLDNDGDVDIVVNSAGNVIIYWLENLDGLGNFGQPQSIMTVPQPTSTQAVFVIDLDGDSDLDVLGIPNNERISWFENLDGNANFGSEQIIATGLISSFNLYAADLDNDSDNDVIYTSTPSAIENTSEIGWIENLDGLGNFGSKQTIVDDLTFARMVFSADLDGDGDNDILSASQNDDTIAWYENYFILDSPDMEYSDTWVYPNPSADFLNLNTKYLDIQRIEIYDSSGTKIQSNIKSCSTIDISNLSSGIYLLKVIAVSYTGSAKFIKI